MQLQGDATKPLPDNHAGQEDSFTWRPRMFLISTRGPKTFTAASHGQKEQHGQVLQIYVQKWVVRKEQNIHPVLVTKLFSL